MADIVERLIERISAANPLEDKVSEVVAGFLERTAGQLSRLPGASVGSGVQGEVPAEDDSSTVAPSHSP